MNYTKSGVGVWETRWYNPDRRKEKERMITPSPMQLLIFDFGPELDKKKLRPKSIRLAVRGFGKFRQITWVIVHLKTDHVLENEQEARHTHARSCSAPDPYV